MGAASAGRRERGASHLVQFERSSDAFSKFCWGRNAERNGAFQSGPKSNVERNGAFSSGRSGFEPRFWTELFHHYLLRGIGHLRIFNICEVSGSRPSYVSFCSIRVISGRATCDFLGDIVAPACVSRCRIQLMSLACSQIKRRILGFSGIVSYLPSSSSYRVFGPLIPMLSFITPTMWGISSWRMDVVQFWNSATEFVNPWGRQV